LSREFSVIVGFGIPLVASRSLLGGALTVRRIDCLGCSGETVGFRSMVVEDEGAATPRRGRELVGVAALGLVRESLRARKRRVDILLS